MIIKPSNTARCFLLLGVLLITFTAAYGHSDEVKIKNTTREIRPGVYECIVYLEVSADVSERIDEVTYLLPYGFEQRKYKGKKVRQGVDGYFSSDPIVTTEEIVINVKIEYKGADDVYRSYKINPYNTVLK